jgi:hypothetical protein
LHEKKKGLQLHRRMPSRAIRRIHAFVFCLFLSAAASGPLAAQTPPTLVLMHSHMGIRIEYDISAQHLNLWISPSPATSLDYHDRNFSNRDDHTSLFDSITIPSLKLEDFLGCDYDAFHSVLHFRNQTLHLASLYDRPVVLLWFEKPGQVNIKTDKSSRILERSPRIFSIRQTDRGKDLAFVAAIAPGAGAFTHQLVLDEGRSTYARAQLEAGQPLFLAGGLTAENIPALVQPLSTQPLAEILSGNESLIAAALTRGNIRLRNLPGLQKLLDVNKRFLLSMQDPEGAQRDTAMSIYYLIWVRSGGMNYPPLAAAGWVDPLRRWNRFELANPTVIENEEPRGRMFGQLISGKINKWEEDGTYYAIFSAFSYWTQTGDKSYLSGENLALLEDAMDWLERHCFDPSQGLFGRYYHSESSLYGSRDYGWDNAVGKPAQGRPPVSHGVTIRRSYDLYINLLSYSSYLMLSAAEQSEKAEAYQRKAEALAVKMQPWLDDSARLRNPDLERLSPYSCRTLRTNQSQGRRRLRVGSVAPSIYAASMGDGSNSRVIVPAHASQPRRILSGRLLLHSHRARYRRYRRARDHGPHRLCGQTELSRRQVSSHALRDEGNVGRYRWRS